MYDVLTETGPSASQVKDRDGKPVAMGSQGWKKELKVREVFGIGTR